MFWEHAAPSLIVMLGLKCEGSPNTAISIKTQFQSLHMPTTQLRLAGG